MRSKSPLYNQKATGWAKKSTCVQPLCLIKVTFSVTLNSYSLSNCKDGSTLLMKSEIETQSCIQMAVSSLCVVHWMLVGVHGGEGGKKKEEEQHLWRSSCCERRTQKKKLFKYFLPGSLRAARRRVWSHCRAFLKKKGFVHMNLQRVILAVITLCP